MQTVHIDLYLLIQVSCRFVSDTSATGFQKQNSSTSNDLPLSILHDERFKEFIETIFPGFELPSKIIVKERIKSHLKSIDYVSIALNELVHTDEISVTVSFISSEFKLETMTLPYKELPRQMDGMLIALLQDLEIPEPKLSCLTTNNASAFAVDAMKIQTLHITCFDQLVHDFVEEIFSMPNVKDLIERTAWLQQLGLEYSKSNKMTIEKFLTCHGIGKYRKYSNELPEGE